MGRQAFPEILIHSGPIIVSWFFLFLHYLTLFNITSVFESAVWITTTETHYSDEFWEVTIRVSTSILYQQGLMDQIDLYAYLSWLSKQSEIISVRVSAGSRYCQSSHFLWKAFVSSNCSRTNTAFCPGGNQKYFSGAVYSHWKKELFRISGVYEYNSSICVTLQQIYRI